MVLISSPRLSITRDLELEALQTAASWPSPAVPAILQLAARFAARGRLEEAVAYFHDRAEADPKQPLFAAFEGQFRLRLLSTVPPSDQPQWLAAGLGKLNEAVERAPGVTTFLRGAALAELPAEAGQVETARADLEWVIEHRDRIPSLFIRAAYRGLARVYTNLGRTNDADRALARSGYRSLDSSEPTFVTDASITRQDGFRFVPPRLVELAPGVHVAQGYDFGDFGFVVTRDRIVAIDAGGVPAHAQQALADLRKVSDLPITDVIVTHSHWDHIGGLRALIGSNVRVIAQTNYASELQSMNETGVPLWMFFGAEQEAYELVPDHVVGEEETLTIGGTEFRLYPAYGGETRDALLIYLPATGVLFTGDTFMPFIGAPFLPEGSAEGLLDTIELIQRISPRLLIHGHTPLTENMTVDVLPALGSAVRELYQQVLDGLRNAETLAQVLGRNVLPDVLRSTPAAVILYLLIRENLIKRVYHQRSGYWKPDGEGMEVPSADEWAAAVALLANGQAERFVDAARTLLTQHDAGLALRIVELGLRNFPGSSELAELRLQALQELRVLNLGLNPFKFIVYSGWAESELAPGALA